MKMIPAFLVLALCSPAIAHGEIVYSVDFTTEADGSAISRLKAQGFAFKLKFEALNPRFEGGALRLSTERPEAGVCGFTFPKDMDLRRAKRVRLTWGVSKFPEGADWERGVNRTPLAVMISFGTERLSSGLPLGIYAAPYFIAPFIGEKEPEGKVYTGKFWKLGGRYIAYRNSKAGEVLVSEIHLDSRFNELFGKSPTPSISAFGIQMNTKDTTGSAAAFVKKIEFLDDR